MFQIRTKLIAIGVALAVLAGGYVAVGAFAESGATPWPDPGQGHGPAVAGQELEGTETPEDAETVDSLETLDAVGVATESPACSGTEADPNPHNTDSDFDGCRDVDGKNLPDPAADAHEGNPGLIGQGHDGDNCGLGPPDGRPRDGRPDGDPPYGPPTDVPLGPRSEPCITPTPEP
jgi:hypothetical protein